MYSSALTQPTPRDRLASAWGVVGFVLIAASVAQPIAASFMVGISPDKMLAPLSDMMGGRPLPPEVAALFSGVFANIQFSLVFSAVKLGLGLTILACVHHLRAGKPWAAKALSIFPLVGIAAFLGIGAFFAYSAVTMAGEMSLPAVVAVSMIAMGIVVALIPSRWLYRQFRMMRALSAGAA